MLRLLLPLAALLSSVALLLAGSGLLTTLLAVRGGLEGFGARTLGLVMSGYFVGFFLGTFVAPALIARIGHVRAFAFYSSLAAATILLHPLWPAPAAWMGLRVITGLALVGLCTIIESWLNAQAAADMRGRVFATYMVISLLALAAGQWLFASQPPGSFALFSLVAILVSLAALPVLATRLAPPELLAPPRSQWRRISRAVPTAAAGALLSGLAMGAFWGLGATFAAGSGLDRAGVGQFMGLSILGGAVGQWPIGRLSDRGDRRTTLALVSAAAGLLALLAAWLPLPPTALQALFFCYGACAFALYPLTVAHLLDHLAPEELLDGCSTVLLLHGIGAAVGPVLAGLAMERFGAVAFPAGFALVLGLLAAIAGGRRLWHGRVLVHATRFHPMLRTTPIALEMLPEIPDAQERGLPT